ncbi:MAG: glutamate-5-semialdehyde dehydrogenase, partial [Acidimicrobiia bacterium]|nr:glutamate-5-semialdehyde dehydrogenase [Acidimicrobiia bacterium]
AKEASRVVAKASTTQKNAALESMAQRLEAAAPGILAANAEDMEQARSEGVSEALLDRLLLTDARIAGMATGLRKVAGLPDPIGIITDGWQLYNGIKVQRQRAPLGVVAVIYEARPNVTADAGGLAFKAGNAAILRGSSYALRSNLAVMHAVQEGLESEGLPATAIQVLEDTSREGAVALMQATEWIDLLVPRGGPGLIAAMIEHATVPYVIDGAGNCHVYVDAAADFAKALPITVNAKVQRPGVCNAAETLLVHESIAAEFLPTVAAALMAEGVELRGDAESRRIVPEMLAATDEDFATEFHDLIMSVGVVPSVEAAVDHVLKHGSGHTDAILSEDYQAIQTFVDGVDSAVTMVNASTRFTDGEEFGFGAEIGISTQKLHVRGPMGLEALTCERYVLYGDGQVR